MYEQKSLMHSYTDTPVSDLKSLSYVSMKIFFHVNGAIFSEIRDHHFLIFSHTKASHIIHHLVLKDVIISEEALILKGQAKEYFNALLKIEEEHEKERVARGITDVLLQEIKLNVFCRVSENSFVEIIARLIDTAMYRFPVDYEIEVTRAE
ncbi:10344_t:CDS:2 [Rhizophagus irregularis]|nr:10344_t:CDS:2 [Rhizophagus irregularis]